MSLSYLHSRVSELEERLDETEELSARLSLLDEISFYVSRYDPVKAGVYARRQIRLAAEAHNDHWVMRGSLRYAASLEARSQYTLERRYLKRAWRLLEQEPENIAERSFVARRLSANAVLTGNMEEAMHHMAVSLDYARQSKDYREIVAALAASGECYRDLGLYAESLDRFEEALRMYEEIVVTDQLAYNGIAHVRFSIGKVYMAMGDHGRAVCLYNEGLKLVQYLGDKDGEMRAYTMLGSTAAECGRYDEAIDWYERATTLAEECGESMVLAGIDLECASMYISQRNYRRALTHLEQAAECFGALRNEPGLMSVSMKKGEVLIAQRKWESAESMLTQALSFFEQTGQRLERCRVHRLLAQTYERLGNLSAALEHYRSYMKLQREVNSHQARAKLVAFEIREREKKVDGKRTSYEKRSSQLEREVRQRSGEVTSVSLRLAQTGDLLSDLRRRMIDIKAANQSVADQVDSIVGDIDRNGVDLGVWKEFEQQLHRLDPDFLHNLRREYPGLTATELRMCTLLRMNLSNKEIAGLLNVSERTIDTHRTSIRRKIGLRRADNLVIALTAL